MQRRPGLVRLAVGNEDRLGVDARPPRGSARSGASQSAATTGLLTITARGRGKQRREQRARIGQEARPDVDRVAALAERDVERPHRHHASGALRGDRLELPREPGDLLASGFDHAFGDFAVERVARRVELDEPRSRIGGVEQRPMAAPARALAQRLGRRVQVDDRAVGLQPFAIRRPDHDAAAGREHDVRQRSELGERRLLAIAEARFAFDLEDRRDRHAELALELGVGVDEASCRAGARAGGRASTCPRPAVRPETDCPDANARGIVAAGSVSARVRYDLAGSPRSQA